MIQKLKDWLEDAEAKRLREAAEHYCQRYEAEAIYDAQGTRWGRHGEEIKEERVA